jgi:hypothetical protein
MQVTSASSGANFLTAKRVQAGSEKKKAKSKRQKAKGKKPRCD